MMQYYGDWRDDYRALKNRATYLKNVRDEVWDVEQSALVPRRLPEPLKPMMTGSFTLHLHRSPGMGGYATIEKDYRYTNIPGSDIEVYI